MATALTMEGIEKSFGANTVLTGVDFAVEFGEVHSLVGENGAGKSTLVKILQGLYIADAGHITVDGVQVKQGDRVPAKDLGIGMVFQESPP
jgi:ribose transport system ATP-binding protein